MARRSYGRNGETIAGDALLIEEMALRDHESFVGKKLLTKGIVVTEAGGYTVGFREPVFVLVEPMRRSDLLAQGWRDLPSGLTFSPLWKVRVLPPVPPGAKGIVDPRIEPVRSYIYLGSKGVQVDVQQDWTEATQRARTAEEVEREAKSDRERAERRAKILAFKRACAHLRATGQHAKADDLESRLDRAEGTSWRVVD